MRSAQICILHLSHGMHVVQKRKHDESTIVFSIFNLCRSISSKQIKPTDHYNIEYRYSQQNEQTQIYYEIYHICN